jgi:hypothetical protein
MREAIVRSLRDVIPTENSMPLDVALDWSKRDWEREEAEQQRRLLDLAAAQRHAAAVQPTRGALVVKLEDSSDDDLYRPTMPRFGDAGQGLITHKYRGCIVVLFINKSVEPNEEQKVLTSGFDQGFTVNTSKQVFRGIW